MFFPPSVSTSLLANVIEEGFFVVVALLLIVATRGRLSYECFLRVAQAPGRKQTPLFDRQTSGWRQVVEQVTEDRRVSLPAIAVQYNDSINAIRVHCGQEAQVQMHCRIFLASQDDFEAFDQFLQRFGLPRNGYQVVNTSLPYGYSASAVLGGVVEQPQPPWFAPQPPHQP